MSRLPTPGSDDNTWGDILNDYLAVVHNTDGTIKTGIITTAHIADATITTTDISATAGITKTQLAATVQTSLGKADTALQSVADATATVKGAVQLAGDLAGTAAAPTIAKLNGIALSVTPPTTGQVLQAISTTAAAWTTPSGGSVSDATTTSKGVVQLAGDLGGTAVAPTVPTKLSLSGGTMTGNLNVIADNARIGVKNSNSSQYNGSSIAIVNNIPGMGNQAGALLFTGIADAGSTKGYLALDKIDSNGNNASHLLFFDYDANTTTSSNTLIMSNKKISSVADPTLAQDAATKAYVDSTAAAGTPDATATTKGKIQLAGDIGGTAASPYIMISGGTFTNYVTNPSFETGYSGWVNYGAYTSISRDNSTSQSGSYSSMHYNNGNNDGGIQSTSISLTPGTYTFSVYAKLSSTVTNASMVVTLSSDFNAIVSINQSYVNANWTRYTATFSVSSTASYVIRLGIGSFGSQSSGTVYYDAISITNGDTANAYFDGSTTGGTWTGVAHESASTYTGRVRLQNTDQLSEGTTNKYFTTARAWTSPTLTGTVTVPSPVNGTDAATKNYVDSNTVTQSQLTSYTVDTSNIGATLAGANGITITETGSQITIGYSGTGGSSSGGSAIGRSIAQVTAAMAAGATASTDYVYYWSGSTAYTLTMPTAVGNTNRYTIKNASTISQPVATTSGQTIEGGVSITISAGNSVDLISNGTNWMVI